MEGHPIYREAPMARSPPERNNWGSRDEGTRPLDRADRTDSFYRGRSPGSLVFVYRSLLSFSSLSITQLHQLVSVPVGSVNESARVQMVGFGYTVSCCALQTNPMLMLPLQEWTAHVDLEEIDPDHLWQ
jgi:hypothetical protein